MSLRKKVLFFLPSNTGGAERMTVTIAKMLPNDKYEVKFVIVHRSLGTIIHFIPKEYEIIHIPIRNIYCATTIRMINTIRAERPDFVFCSLLYLNIRLIIAAKLCRVKAIVRNNIDLSRTPHRITAMMVRLVYKWAYKVIAQQEEMCDEIIKFTNLTSDKVVTLHNPLDVESIIQKSKAPSPFSDDGTQIKYVWVGRFGKVKGQDLAIQALEIVRKTYDNAHLYLVGAYDWSNAYDSEVKKYVETHSMSDYVHFVGFDSNPYRWVKYCDCYVMPSRLEGLPNSLIDAMYLGKPVVATKCIPVVSRIVKDGYNGMLAETENAKSIAECMVKALSLKNFEMTYKPAEKNDFCRLFN